MEDLVTEWMDMRGRHPFFGEKLSDEKISEIWNRSAATYDDRNMGTIPDEIVEHLVKNNTISNDSSVMDIGCGPGTYGLRFSKHVYRVVCIDESGEMLNRLREKCQNDGYGNISIIQADWKEYHSDEKCDVVFSSLCPPLNCPECILKMERNAVDRCAYVSSMNDDRGSIHMDIWKELGKDYTFNGYNTNYPYRFLKSVGRDPVLHTFRISSPYDQTVQEVIDFEVNKFQTYMDIDEKLRRKIENVVISHSDTGTIHFEGIKQLGLLTWVPADADAITI